MACKKNDSYIKIDFLEKSGHDYSDIRITVDTYEDYALMNIVYFMLGSDFNYKDIINLLRKTNGLKY